ncbi:NeuD/PglB/VioB family sugar acetyltransferase [Pigmentiphaga sp. GD03639]|uniref:NeuD/PglB/VioB family sugar acetyltransferase n=1 Tax=Pigmentiphaga sp. GD03639 TaxID=2975354 RepID=UPI0024483F55|nr:NeuD/PglB/VioB family sugar acetyltransferase [Pigmentiphaga sp. GD03639]MDH2239850.1 NeuD/PglB/VioB family sugar acetyltransferase [Pigmentiphaga sp. GD03639]
MSDKETICLFGAGGHGKVVASQLSRKKDCQLLFGDAGIPIGSSVIGIPVVYSTIDTSIAASVLITIGANDIRERLQTEAQAIGLNLSYFIAEPERYFSDTPGAGSMILAGALINRDSRIGKGVIVNSGAIVEHDCEVGDFSHLAPGSVIAGGVRLGRAVLLGANATILPSVVVADKTVIGAGAVVTEDILVPGVYIGAPARRVPSNCRP